MPQQQIDIPGFGVVEFPEGMADADISAAIKRNILKTSSAPPAPSTEPPPVPPTSRQSEAGALGPIPGTELTGLPPVRMIPPSGMMGVSSPTTPPAEDFESRYRRIPSAAGMRPRPLPAPPPSREQLGVRYDPLGANPMPELAAARAGRFIGDKLPPGNEPGPTEMPEAAPVLAKYAARGALGTIKGTGQGLRLLAGNSPEGGGVARAAGGGIEWGAGKLLDLVPLDSPDEQAMIGTKTWAEDPTQLFNPYYMAKQAGMAGGSMVAFMAPTVAIMGRVSTAAGASRAAAAMTVAESLANSAEVYDDAKRAGKTDLEAAELFRANLPKDLPFTYLTNRLGLFNEKIKSPTLRYAAGNVVEPVQEVGQGAIANQTMGRPLAQGAPENALGGLIGGHVGSLISPISGAGAHPVQTNQYQAPPPMDAPAPPQMLPVEPMAPIQPQAATQTVEPVAPPRGGMEQIEPLDAPAPPPPQAAAAPPARAPIPREPAELQEILEFTKTLGSAGTSAVSKQFGISQDDARLALDTLAQEGALEPKTLEGGTTIYINTEARRLRKEAAADRGGKALAQKPEDRTPVIAKFMAKEEQAEPPVEAAEPERVPEPVVEQELGFVPEPAQPRQEGVIEVPKEEYAPENRIDAQPRVAPEVGPAAPLRAQELANREDATGALSAENAPVAPTVAKNATVQQPSAPRSSDDIQADIDAEEDRLEAQGLDVIHMFDPSIQFQGRPQRASDLPPGYTPTPDRLLALQHEMARELQRRDQELQSGLDERLQSVIADPSKRRDLIIKVGEFDQPFVIRGYRRDRWAEIGPIADKILKFALEENGAHDAFAEVRAELGGTGSKPTLGLRVKTSSNPEFTKPSRQAYARAQEILNALTGNSLFRYVNDPAPKNATKSLQVQQPSVENQTGPAMGESKAEPGSTAIPEGPVMMDPRAERGEQSSIEIGEQPDNRAGLTGERLTAGFDAPLTPEEKRAGLAPAEDTQQSMFEEPKERTANLFSAETPAEHVGLDKLTEAGKAADARLRKRGIATGLTAPSNIFLDPSVIRDMAVSIAGSVAKGIITAKNYAAQIVTRFGKGAGQVTRKVWGLANRLVARNQQQTQQQAAPSAPVNTAPRPGYDVYQGKQKEATPGTKSTLEKVQEAALDFVHGFTRQYRHLEFGPRFAELKVKLNQMAADKSTSVHRAAQAIIDQLKTFGRLDYEQFVSAVILDDLVERIEMAKADGDPIRDEELPFDIKTVADVYRFRDYARQDARANPKVVEALRLREEVWNEIKPLYIEAMAAINVDVSKLMRNPKYFHHQVLKYMDLILNALGEKKGGDGSLRSPTGRGWMKKAKVNALAYSSDYIGAEYEVLNEMMKDTGVATFIEFLKNPKNGLNIAPTLSKQTAAHNKAAVMPTFAAIARRWNKQYPKAKKPMTAESVYKSIMNKKQSIAMRKLKGLARGGAFASAPARLQDAVKKLAAGKASIVDAMPLANWVMQGGAANQQEAKAAGLLLKGVAEKRKLTKKLAGKRYIGNLEQAYKAFAQDTHVIWQPEKGNYFYMAATIDDQLAMELLAKQVGPVDAKLIQRKMVRGGKRLQVVIPREVQQTLDEYMQHPQGIWANIGKVITVPTNLWKQNVLVNPVTFIPYNIRNQIGDSWFTLIIAPHAFTYAPQAFGEVTDYLRTGHWKKGSDAERWWRHGGMGSILQVAEMGEVNKLDEFRKLAGKNNSDAKRFAKWWVRAAKKPWKWTRTITDGREAILRLAMFHEFVQQMKANNGVPKTYGASIRSEVMAIPDIYDRAFKLANDAMLPYNEVSHHGQAVRAVAFPFYSFTERAAVHTKRLIQNAAIDGKTAAAVGYGIAGAANIGFHTAFKIGQTAIYISGLKALLSLYSWYYDKDEEGLPESVKKDSHILLGRDDTNRIRTFNRVVPLDDTLEIFGLNSAPYFFKKYLNNQLSWEDFKKELVLFHVGGVPIPIKPFAQKVVQGITPVFKYPAELLFGKSLFPDMTNPRTIRDRYAYIARELRVLYLYNKVFALPQAPFEALDLVGVRRYDVNETLYKEFKHDKVPEWALHGKKAPSRNWQGDAQGEALYNMRMSLRYPNKRALIKALADYHQASEESGKGGSRQELQRAIDRAHPLGQLNKKDRKAYVDSLSPADHAKLDQAVEFWQENFNSKREELDLAAVTGGLPAKKAKKRK